MAAPLSVELEFGGGAELLFDGVKKHRVTLPSQPEPWDIRNLLAWIKGNLLKERPELFVQGDSVRPGILVLVNDADWELLVQKSTVGPILSRFPALTRNHANGASTASCSVQSSHNVLLKGELDYKLQDQDNVVFISTLHGG